MKELTPVQNILFATGALMMVIGAGGMIFGSAGCLMLIMPEVASILFAIGAVMFAGIQLQQTYQGSNFVIRRLRRIMVIGDICFILAAVFMLENTFHVIYGIMATSIDGYNAYIHYIYNNWVVFLLIAAILEIYTTHRISYEIKKEMD